MMLAQLPPPDSYTGIGWLIVGLAALCVAANQVDDFFARRKTKEGTPPNEQLEQAHNHLRTEFDKHVIADEVVHKDIFHRMGGSERGVEKRLSDKIERFDVDAKESREKMHREITDLSKSVSGLETAVEMTNQRVMQIDGKLDRLIEKS